MSVGDKVKKIIQRRGLSQEDVAYKIGLDKSGMSKLVNNKRKVEEAMLLKLSEVLGVSSDELLGREPKELPLGVSADDLRMFDDYQTLDDTDKKYITGIVDSVKKLKRK